MTQDRAISSESTLTAGDEGDVAYESQSLTLNLIRGVCAGCVLGVLGRINFNGR